MRRWDGCCRGSSISISISSSRSRSRRRTWIFDLFIAVCVEIDKVKNGGGRQKERGESTFAEDDGERERRVLGKQHVYLQLVGNKRLENGKALPDKVKE
jgi:hypothetical protein